MTKDKSRIQSCIDHINTAVDVDPWAKELVAEMGKEILKAQLSCEGTTSDCISRQAVRFIETNSDSYPEEWNDDYEKGFTDALNKVIALPSVQPDIIHCKDCKHWREGTAFSYCDKLHGMGVLDALDYMTAEDDYCSMAEREDDETD